MELQAEGAGRRLQVFCIYLGKSGTGRVDEVRNGAIGMVVVAALAASAAAVVVAAITVT